MSGPAPAAGAATDPAEEIVPGIWQLRTEPWGPQVPLYLRLVTGGGWGALIDSGLRSTWPRLLELLGTAGLAVHDVRLLLTTHAHFDCVGAHATARAATGCLVAAAAGSVSWIEDPERQYREYCLAFPDLIADSPALRTEVRDGWTTAERSTCACARATWCGSARAPDLVPSSRCSKDPATPPPSSATSSAARARWCSATP